MKNIQNLQNHPLSIQLTQKNVLCDEKGTFHVKKHQNQLTFRQRKSRNMDIKNWQRSQKQKWLIFIVKLSMENIYGDIEEDLMSSDYTQKFYVEMEKHISTRVAKECQRYTIEVISKYYQKQSKFLNLAQWALNLLGKDANEEIIKLSADYKIQMSTKSSYMQGIQDLQKLLNESDIKRSEN